MQLTTAGAVLVMFAQRRGMTQDDIDDKSRYANLEADNTALLNKLEQLDTSAKDASGAAEQGAGTLLFTG